MELIRKNPLISNNLNCGTDIQCLQREAEAVQKHFDALTQSPTWINNKCNIVAQIEYSNQARRPNPQGDAYAIDASYNDELFIINGEKFEAKTYCFNMEEGDEVLFIEGNPLGACAAATVINLRTRHKCELWCE